MEIFTQKCSTKLNLEDFALISVLGKGEYSKVILVKDIKTGYYYALKIIKKKNKD